jgi:hypothetical protein
MKPEKSMTSVKIKIPMANTPFGMTGVRWLMGLEIACGMMMV